MEPARRITKHIGLRLARPSDAAFILGLRLNENRNRYLSPVNNDVAAQERWLEQYVEREKAGLERYYIILDKDDRDIGTIRLYDYRGDSFCQGSWVVVPDAPNYQAIETTVSIYEIGFGELGFKRTHFDVQLVNDRVIAFNVFFGARKTTQEGGQQQFEMTLEEYLAVRKRYVRFLVDPQMSMPPSTPST